MSCDRNLVSSPANAQLSARRLCAIARASFSSSGCVASSRTVIPSSKGRSLGSSISIVALASALLKVCLQRLDDQIPHVAVFLCRPDLQPFPELVRQVERCLSPRIAPVFLAFDH